MKLSSRVETLPSSGIRKIFDRAVELELGGVGATVAVGVGARAVEAVLGFFGVGDPVAVRVLVQEVGDEVAIDVRGREAGIGDVAPLLGVGVPIPIGVEVALRRYVVAVVRVELELEVSLQAVGDAVAVGVVAGVALVGGVGPVERRVGYFGPFGSIALAAPEHRQRDQHVDRIPPHGGSMPASVAAVEGPRWGMPHGCGTGHTGSPNTKISPRSTKDPVPSSSTKDPTRPAAGSMKTGMVTRKVRVAPD